MNNPVGSNDAILFVSLLYSCIDLCYEWDLFATCHRPIHRWLLTSYGCVIAFRVAHLWGAHSAASCGTQSSSAAPHFLLDLRQKGCLPRILAGFTWIVALPFFVLWTLLGSYWHYEVMMKTPQCVPSATHIWFSAFWLLLCYIWIFVHVALGSVALILERRVRRAESDLQQLEDDDVISRWGHVSQLQGYTSLAPQSQTGAGLSPSEIRTLPGVSMFNGEHRHAISEDNECPICINEYKIGESLRTLESCGHCFHRSCIDLWLLRRADCPLCKRSTR